jgi:hypothetical protein
LEKGGTDNLTEGTRQLCQRAALLSAITEDLETRWLSGEPTDLGLYFMACNTQRRILATLGLERQGPRDVSPSLAGYLSGKAEAPDDSEAPA